MGYEIKTMHTIGYLLRKFGAEGTSIIKLIKLLVIADVYKLRKYGSELLHREEYFAMQNGPVPSKTADLLEQSESHLSEEELKMTRELWERVAGKKTVWGTVRLIGTVDEGYLAELDKEALDYAYTEYGAYSAEELIDMVHEYHAWKKHEETLRIRSRKAMDKMDFFVNDSGPASMAPDCIESSKRYFFDLY